VHIGRGERQMAQQSQPPADDIDAPPTERHRAVHLYTLTITATDAAGNKSKPKTLKLTVLPKR
jgi:hypothetical protein